MFWKKKKSKQCTHEVVRVNANWTALVCDSCSMKFVGGDKAYRAERNRLGFKK